MPATRSLRCADAARQRAEPRFASAPRARQWLLLEHPGPWGEHLRTDSGLAPDLILALDRWAEQTGGRVQLIRRPGFAHRRDEPGRHWYWADSRLGRERLRCGLVDDESGILDVLAQPGTAGEPTGEPVYLVCTHGKHDRCCAVLGRPVAAQLAAQHPQRTWECSHLGGHRFAANLVLLPHGLYYGQLTPAVAGGVVCAYGHGRLSLPWLRGRSALPAPVQAAQHFVRTAVWETGVDSYPPLSCEPAGPDTWAVQLTAPDGSPVTVVVRARLRRTDDPLSCAATGPSEYRIFELVRDHG